MKTAVIGFPRIGKDRELKFTLEKYFKGEINQDDIYGEADRQKEYGLNSQSEAGIDFISSNDFSFYDGVLDTAVLFNVIPKRYEKLELSAIDTYFAMARGYQKGDKNVKALAMKKWFNTNYHYIVPEIEDDTEVSFVGTKPLDEYENALSKGISTKTAIVGPFTFLKLLKYTGTKCFEDYIDIFTDEYIKLITALDEKNVEWLQLDEPWLVKDIDEGEKAIFTKIYNKILSNKKSVKVLLQTYFGDVRDVYNEIVELDFDGIGLDFAEGKETLSLVQKNGFPKDKILFAGLVNGKNIWKNNYANTLQVLKELKEAGVKQIVISTSCSLLHVPYTLENETELSSDSQSILLLRRRSLRSLRNWPNYLKQRIMNQLKYSNRIKRFLETERIALTKKLRTELRLLRMRIMSDFLNLM